MSTLLFLRLSLKLDEAATIFGIAVVPMYVGVGFRERLSAGGSRCRRFEAPEVLLGRICRGWETVRHFPESWREGRFCPFAIRRVLCGCMRWGPSRRRRRADVVEKRFLKIVACPLSAKFGTIVRHRKSRCRWGQAMCQNHCGRIRQGRICPRPDFESVDGRVPVEAPLIGKVRIYVRHRDDDRVRQPEK